jgi:hypothetical protein
MRARKLSLSIHQCFQLVLPPVVCSCPQSFLLRKFAHSHALGCGAARWRLPLIFLPLIFLPLIFLPLIFLPEIFLPLIILFVKWGNRSGRAMRLHGSNTSHHLDSHWHASGTRSYATGIFSGR